nr:hypothetical protein Iba_chr04aCG0210 [Ipomoea batatas]
MRTGHEISSTKRTRVRRWRRITGGGSRGGAKEITGLMLKSATAGGALAGGVVPALRSLVVENPLEHGGSVRLVGPAVTVPTEKGGILQLPVAFRVSSKGVLRSSGGKVVMSGPSLTNGDPSALNMGRTLKPSALTTSSAPHVRTILLGLVPTVLASAIAP